MVGNNGKFLKFIESLFYLKLHTEFEAHKTIIFKKKKKIIEKTVNFENPHAISRYKVSQKANDICTPNKDSVWDCLFLTPKCISCQKKKIS
jgi:hypothetical protein